ncbi:helix-turn-helix transcriptional regulator [Nonomuraea sp. LPB2021202275-12-8]|uniref:helix-turn-helix transcriptional regulator n=1 Tax=Nonomuraea sp. LPB2021202275-12-8 TaxID=3120159 RepID=UPI00300C71F3
MDRASELGEFLRSRRNRLRPEEVGLTSGGLRRQVPGLRREELAQLAGVSVAYYVRLEQGQSKNASDGVLDALARALKLNETETAHLHSLARPTRAARKKIRPERLRPSLATMINSFENVPAYIVGRRTDVLAWNRMAHALLAGHLDFDAPQRPADRPNMARMLFLDPHTCELFTDWKRRARDSVACLRLTAGCFPGDTALMTLIGELTVNSLEFASLWAAHPIQECASTTERYQHPLVGPMTLDEEVMQLPGDAGQRLIVINARPDSSSAAAINLLADMVSSSARVQRESIHPRTLQ